MEMEMKMKMKMDLDEMKVTKERRRITATLPTDKWTPAHEKN